MQTYRAKRTDFDTLIASLDKADDNGSDMEIDFALEALSAFFDKHSQSRQRAPLDPNNLPWRTPKVTNRQPIADTKGFQTAFFGQERPKLAAVGKTTGISVPKVLPAKPNADDLAETEDVQITPAIRAKAQELGNEPLAIYLWVRNNIRFTPTYGSVQGSQDTLDKLSGNAFDTASLLIALLRAANVPARYAYGTIDVPVDKVMNWVGGTTNIAAAQQVLGQGGIPNAALVTGGGVKNLRMEHVWVEAWIDYLPSRGAQHVEGDTWIPVDASYKQYTFTQGMDLKSGVPFDANVFLASVQQGATVNQTEGWVQNLNQANIQTTATNYQNQLKAYVDSRKPDATVGDVLGTQSIAPITATVFGGVLPYKVVAYGPIYAALPETLRHQFQYKLYADAYSRSIDNPIWTFQRSLPRLTGKKVTLSFRPSSQADADLIASYLPQPHADGSPTQPSEIPSALPALAYVTPELAVEGETVASGGSFKLGSELSGQGGFTQYDFSGWDLTSDDTLVAGQPSALGLSIQGISESQALALKERITQTKLKLEAQNFAGVSGEILTGDVLTSAVWSYFASVQTHGQLARRQAGMIDRPSLSYGLLHSKAKPNKLYGVILVSITFPGVLMDIGHLRHVRVAKDNNATTWANYNRVRGQFASAMEHSVIEASFVDRGTCNLPGSQNPDPSKPACAEAASAVKAIATAQVQGQKVFKITRENQNVIYQLTVRSDTLSEIQDAVAADKEVTIPSSSVTIGGWSGIGYTIVDPQTGAGSYIIEGGANGGEIDGLEFIAASMGLAFLTVAAVFVISTLWVAILAGALGLIANYLLNKSFKDDSRTWASYNGLRFLTMALLIPLFIILDSIVIISLPALFVLGLALSLLMALVTISYDLIISLSAGPPLIEGNKKLALNFNAVVSSPV